MFDRFSLKVTYISICGQRSLKGSVTTHTPLYKCIIQTDNLITPLCDVNDHALLT